MPKFNAPNLPPFYRVEAIVDGKTITPARLIEYESEVVQNDVSDPATVLVRFRFSENPGFYTEVVAMSYEAACHLRDDLIEMTDQIASAVLNPPRRNDADEIE